MSLRAVVVVASTLLATACSNVMTVDDVVTESAAISDYRLIADWYQVDGVERAHISRGASNDYAVSYVDKENSAQLRGRLGRMGKMIVMDLFPDMKQWSARGETGIPFHVTVAIEDFGDSVAAYGLDGDSVLA